VEKSRRKLNDSSSPVSKLLMSQLKLLKAPARRLLLTFVMTAGMAAGVSAASPQISARPAYSHHASASTRARARQQIDYSQIEGIQRWGINE
jgi:hypothetical protein